ncbi:hypothetical protein OEV98_05190 [Caldibacillus lycopersici]|uniref:Uncharacterized protein n=1 Tax=Perspicuibacillus lycopersici TaxID=1325689 RepID=A0AAE3LSN8_9BACI|nr:hypothetical protein [Perspicuibacillus lycopersici]MCU9612943.1 hypothetical protein [Perspicuibacillus lycopersici]
MIQKSVREKVSKEKRTRNRPEIRKIAGIKRKVGKKPTRNLLDRKYHKESETETDPKSVR